MKASVAMIFFITFYYLLLLVRLPFTLFNRFMEVLATEDESIG